MFSWKLNGALAVRITLNTLVFVQGGVFLFQNSPFVLPLSQVTHSAPNPSSHSKSTDFFFIYLFFSPLGTIQTGQSKLNFVFLFSYMWSGPLASQMQCIRLVWSQASFIVNNGFLHRERIQLLPIKWQRYIIALIKQGYYEPAGAQCHRTEWKTGSLDVHSSGLSEQCSSPLPWYNFSSPNKMAVYSCCDISV